MTINHTIPSTVRRPGEFHIIDTKSSAVGLVPLDAAVLLIGVQGSTALATADVYQEMFDEAQADSQFEQGSEIALMVRKAFEQGRKIGFQPRIFAAGIADPAGTAATWTITVQTGTAAAAGDIVFRIGERSFRAGVSLGDSQTTIATAIVNAIDADLKNLPVTAASALGVVTLTFNFTGVNGNDLKINVDDVGLIGLTVVGAAGVAGVGAATPATALSNSLSRFFESKAIANHATADVTTLDTHLDAAWDATAKRWTFAFMGQNGTLSAANTISNTANDERLVNVSCEDSPSLPLQIAAAAAVTVSARSQPNFNWDYSEIALALPPDASAYTDTELESALAAGTTPLIPNDNRTSLLVNRMITTKTLDGAAPFENTKDLSTMRGLVHTIRQIDAAWVQQFRAQNKSQRILNRMKSVAYNVLKLLEAQEVLQNVEALKGQLLVEADATVKTRAVAKIPESIIPNLHQSVLVHTLYVE